MSVVNNAVLVDLNISIWTGRKQDRQVSSEIDQAKSTKTKAGNYSKNLFAGTDKLEKVVSVAGKIRNWHLKQTLPWSDSGTRLLPMGNFMTYKQQLSQYEAEFQQAVSDFIAAYPTLISAAAFQIGALFDRDDYPSPDALQHKFGIRYSFTPVPLAGDFRVDTDNETQEELRKHYEEQYRRKEEESARELWDRLHTYLKGMAERLEKLNENTQTADGKTRRLPFHESHLTNGAELCELLTRLNVTNDPKLEAARKDLEAALSGVTVKDIRTSAGVQQDVKAKVESILSKFDF